MLETTSVNGSSTRNDAKQETPQVASDYREDRSHVSVACRDVLDEVLVRMTDRGYRWD
jgi:hypothetical protein